MDFEARESSIPIRVHNSCAADRICVVRRVVLRLALASTAGIALNNAVLAADPAKYIDVNSSATGNQNNDGALGADSIAIGPDAATSSTADGAIAFGNGAQANAENAISIGNNIVGGGASFAVGTDNAIGSGNYIFLSGAQNTVAAANSETLIDGNINTVAGTGNSKIQMLGSQNTLQGNNSSMVQMLGASNVALGGTSNSAMIGSGNTLGMNNKSNSVIGVNNTLGSNNSFVSVLGVSNTTTGNGSYNFIGGANNNVGANAMNNILIARNATVADGLADTIGLGNAVVVGQNNAVALGNGAKAAASAGDVALGAGSVTSAAHTGAFVIAGSTTPAMGTGGANVLSVGTSGAERQIQNLGAGVLSASSTDAINGSQLYATNRQVDQDTSDIATLQQDALQWNTSLGAYDASHGGATAQKISNVAAGALNASSTDAVNGAQLYATNQQVAQNAADIASNSTAINNLNTQVNKNSTDIANNSAAITQIGNQVTQNSADISNLSQGIANGTVGLVQQTGGAPGDGQITIGAATGGTSISVAGTNGDRTLSGVAAGIAGDDAVNVAQLQSAIANATFNGVQYDDANRTSVTFNAGGQAVGLHNVAAGGVSAGSTDAINGAQLYATNQQVANNTTQISDIEAGKAGPFRANNSSGLAAPSATGTDAVAGGFGAAANGNQSTAIGTRASATGSNSVALGYASSDDGRDNVVSVGSGGAERQITNVAAGTKPTDAVNLGQLNQGLAGTLTQANTYTDSRIAALTYDINKVRRDGEAGTASALAVAGLPQAFTPGAGMIAGGFGVYRDETAFAIGASKIFNDGHTVVKGGASFTSRSGTVGANLGIGYQF